jgi:hypothetical protein
VLKINNANLHPPAEGDETCLRVMDACHNDQKLELVLCEKQAGEMRLESRLVAWDHGLGYRQQTRTLPADVSLLGSVIRSGAENPLALLFPLHTCDFEP